MVTSLTHFANITLSSLYFDITKDSLYADALQSRERRAVITVLQEVCSGVVPLPEPCVKRSATIDVGHLDPDHGTNCPSPCGRNPHRPRAKRAELCFPPRMERGGQWLSPLKLRRLIRGCAGSQMERPPSSGGYGDPTQGSQLCP